MAVRKKPEPIHAIFYVCSEYTTDSAWQDFLKECSFGKFPRGVKFENGAIKCTRKNQMFTEHLPKDSKEAYEVINHVFRDKLNIKTSREKKCAAIRFDKKVEESRIQTWKGATTIGSKQSMIRNYVDQLSHSLYFSDEERKETSALLEIAIANKILDSRRIHVKDGQIILVEGLQFDAFTRKISLLGKFSKPESVLYPIPLDYTPKAQIKHQKQYMEMVDYHVNKFIQSQG